MPVRHRTCQDDVEVAEAIDMMSTLAAYETCAPLLPADQHMPRLEQLLAVLQEASREDGTEAESIVVDI